MKRSEQYRLADMSALADVLSNVGFSDLTNGEVALLKTELAKPAYAGKTSGERVKLLMGRTLVDNPASLAQVRKPATIHNIKEWLRPIVLTASPANQAKWIPKSGVMFGLYDSGYVVEYNSVTFTPLRMDALADKLITQAQLDEMFPLVDDPSYNSMIWQTPCEAILGDLSVVTLGDVVRAEA